MWFSPFLFSIFCQDETIPLILKCCEEEGLQVSWHIEPYKGRSAKSVLANMQYISETYGSSRAMYRHSGAKGLLPLFYVYDSYLIDKKEWAEILNDQKVGYAIGLLVEQRHLQDLQQGKFDGMV